MRHQVEISKIRMRDIVRIHHHARRAVSISKVIRVTRVMREELDMVPLPDHDHRDFGVDLEVGACLCGLN